jgi:hypothetical protein
MRIVATQDDMREIDGALSQLVLIGKTPVIRYKAYLATQVFASPEMFREVSRSNYTSGDDYFTAIASRLQQSMLGFTSK